MKYALRILGVFAILFALYIIVGEQLVGSSGEAFVNTRLATVRAPVQGALQLSAPPAGGRVTSTEVLGNVFSRQTNELQLSGLAQAQALATADLSAAGSGAGVPSRPVLQARVSALNELMERVRAALQPSRGGALRSPVDGIVWSLSAFSGSEVNQGEPVLTVADCASPFIHASVDQRLYNRLSVGQRAQFRFHDGRVVNATVALLAGTGPRTLLETVAINPTERQLEGFTVLLSAPGLTTSRECALGRTGRVIFSAGPLAAIGEVLSGLGL